LAHVPLIEERTLFASSNPVFKGSNLPEIGVRFDLNLPKRSLILLNHLACSCCVAKTKKLIETTIIHNAEKIAPIKLQ